MLRWVRPPITSVLAILPLLALVAPGSLASATHDGAPAESQVQEITCPYLLVEAYRHFLAQAESDRLPDEGEIIALERVTSALRAAVPEGTALISGLEMEGRKVGLITPHYQPLPGKIQAAIQATYDEGGGARLHQLIRHLTETPVLRKKSLTEAGSLAARAPSEFLKLLPKNWNRFLTPEGQALLVTALDSDPPQAFPYEDWIKKPGSPIEFKRKLSQETDPSVFEVNTAMHAPQSPADLADRVDGMFGRFALAPQHIWFFFRSDKIADPQEPAVWVQQQSLFSGVLTLIQTLEHDPASASSLLDHQWHSPVPALLSSQDSARGTVLRTAKGNLKYSQNVSRTRDGTWLDGIEIRHTSPEVLASMRRFFGIAAGDSSLSDTPWEFPSIVPWERWIRFSQGIHSGTPTPVAAPITYAQSSALKEATSPAVAGIYKVFFGNRAFWTSPEVQEFTGGGVAPLNPDEVAVPAYPWQEIFPKDPTFAPALAEYKKDLAKAKGFKDLGMAYLKWAKTTRIEDKIRKINR